MPGGHPIQEPIADVTLYGPSGLRRFVRAAMNALAYLPSARPPPMPVPMPDGTSALGVSGLVRLGDGCDDDADLRLVGDVYCP
jgi:hypothetical protein